MKWLALLLTAIIFMVFAVMLGPVFSQDPGYVMVRFMDWRLETSVLVLLIGVVLLYAAVRLVVWLWTMPARTLQRSQQRRAQVNLERGLLALTEGDWQGAEKALLKSRSARGQETVALLGAARAAQGQDAGERRDEYLERATDGSRRKTFLVELTRARLLLGSGQFEDARRVLEDLHKRRSRHPQVLALLARCYRNLGDWNGLEHLMPRLKKAGLLEAEEVLRIKTLAAAQRLETAADLSELQQVWRGLSRAQRQQADLSIAYSRRSNQLNAPEHNEPVIRNALKHDWQSKLIRLYAVHGEDDITRRISHCEKWLEAHPGDPDLHLTLGRLCIDGELWGKAQQYLGQSLAVEPSAEGHQALGDLLHQQGDLKAAMDHYRDALALSNAAVGTSSSRRSGGQLTGPGAGSR